MAINRKFLNLILSVLLLTHLSACGQDMFEKMDSAERKFNEAQSQRVVAFMSLETMFPDPQVRALAKAAGKGKIKKIEQLFKEGVSVNARGTQGATPLFWAMHNYNGFKKLLELGADPNLVFSNGDGGSVMHAAVTAGDERYLKITLEYGGNPNLIDNQFGETPLFSALAVGLEAIDLLLEAGANINAKDHTQSTAVMVAAALGRYEIVYSLLEHGADFKAKNENGHDLADRVAANLGMLRPDSESAKWQSKVIRWLEAKGVDIPMKRRAY